MMQLTIRVPDEYGEALDRMSKKLRLRRSDIVRMALREFLEENGVEEEGRPFDKVSHLLGITASGVKDLGQRHREHLIRKFKKVAS